MNSSGKAGDVADEILLLRVAYAAAKPAWAEAFSGPGIRVRGFVAWRAASRHSVRQTSARSIVTDLR
jgi:hypothetical protein